MELTTLFLDNCPFTKFCSQWNVLELHVILLMFIILKDALPSHVIISFKYIDRVLT
jgi:hypothetical protein